MLHLRPPAGIWVVFAVRLTMTFAAFTSALIAAAGLQALDWRHLALPNILYFNTLPYSEQHCGLKWRDATCVSSRVESRLGPALLLGSCTAPSPLWAGLRSRAGVWRGHDCERWLLSGSESQQFVFLCCY